MVEISLPGMDEHGEVFNKEQVVVSPELQDRIGEATRAIEMEQQDPALAVATGTEQMSMFSELGKLAKDTTVHKLGILFKDVKAVFGILPNIGKISEWNTARIAKIPNAAKATTMTAEGVIGVSDKTVQEVAIADVAKREASAVGMVDAAMRTELAATKAEKEYANAKSGFDSAVKRHENAIASGKGVDRASENLRKAEAKFFKAEEQQHATQQAYENARKQAIGKLNEPTATAPEGAKAESWLSKKTRTLARIKKDPELKAKYDAVKAKFQKNGVQYTEDTLLRIVANGEAPAFTAGEKAGRFAKHMGLHMIMEQIGPIINPTPDVPGLVTLASFGAEVIGQQWWAALVPPVWQYLHNRYEDTKLSFETSTKAAEIIRRHWNARVDRLEEKQIEKAAGVFLPKKELPLGV